MPSLYQPLKCFKFLHAKEVQNAKWSTVIEYESVSCLWCVEKLRNVGM